MHSILVVYVGRQQWPEVLDIKVKSANNSTATYVYIMQLLALPVGTIFKNWLKTYRTMLRRGSLMISYTHD